MLLWWCCCCCCLVTAVRNFDDDTFANKIEEIARKAMLNFQLGKLDRTLAVIFENNVDTLNDSPWGQSQRYLAAYFYIFLTNVELETLFSTITKGDGELYGDSLDSTWSRFERNTGKHMQQYTWPLISCTSWGKLMVKLLCTRPKKWVSDAFWNLAQEKVSFFRCVYYFQCSRNRYFMNVLTRKLTSIVNKFYLTTYSGRLKVTNLWWPEWLGSTNLEVYTKQYMLCFHVSRRQPQSQKEVDRKTLILMQPWNSPCGVSQDLPLKPTVQIQ